MMNQSPQGLASLGRNGDTMLMHVSPREVQGLQGLAMAQGGSLTINPDTGLPEAFSLKGMFKSFLPTLAGAAASFIPGMQFMSPLVKGILAGATTGALTNKNNRLLGAITGGLGGYSGASIGQAAMASGLPAQATQAGLNPTDPLVVDALKGGYTTPARETFLNQAQGFSGPTTPYSQLANSNLAGQGTFNPALSQSIPGAAVSTASTPTFMGNLSTAGRGVGEIFSGNQNAIDAYTKAIGAESGLGALGKTLLPVGGAALGGLEESDIYGKPMQKPEAEKYDPYARLDLSNDTGLRLVAKGGYIEGMVKYGQCLEYGSGVRENQAEAILWYKKAADKKSASALFFLGSAHANGRGVAKDFSRAVDLWKQSSKMGNQDAIRRLTTIGVEVTD